MSEGMASDGTYDRAYYEALREGTRRSAEIIVPHLIALLAPGSVVDVGCGVGLWLEAFRRHGVADVLGIDGDWAPEVGLAIPDEQFCVADLAAPVRLARRFDLVLCLEVAEHLPAEAAPVLVESLTRLGPAVVFSAAIPFQRGRGHVNERWPSYWAELFAAHGFAAIDTLRERFWTEPAIEVWYQQNLLIFADPGWLVRRDRGPAAPTLRATGARDLVHPRQYQVLIEEIAEWRRYVDVLKARVAQLEREREAMRGSVLGRLQRALRSVGEAPRRWLGHTDKGEGPQP